jgi:hypothetical protein
MNILKDLKEAEVEVVKVLSETEKGIIAGVEWLLKHPVVLQAIEAEIQAIITNSKAIVVTATPAIQAAQAGAAAK